MKSLNIQCFILLIASCFFLFPLTAWGGSKSKAKGGPPLHAPAHGYRAKHHYHYYPRAEVYYDTSRKLYFYMQGDGWKASVSLPLDLKVRLGDYVSVEMESDKPYLKQ